MRRQTINGRRGFTILELLVTLALLGAFALVASKLTDQMIHLLREAPAAELEATAESQVLAKFRADVWSARAMTTASDRVSVRLPGEEKAVEWKLGAGGLLARTSGGVETAAVKTLPAGARFETTPMGVVLVAGDLKVYAYSELIRLSAAATTRPTTRAGGMK